MDALLQDLGPAEVTNLYGQQLRASRLKNHELQNVRMIYIILESGDDGAEQYSLASVLH